MFQYGPLSKKNFEIHVNFRLKMMVDVASLFAVCSIVFMKNQFCRMIFHFLFEATIKFHLQFIFFIFVLNSDTINDAHRKWLPCNTKTEAFTCLPTNKVSKSVIYHYKTSATYFSINNFYRRFEASNCFNFFLEYVPNWRAFFYHLVSQ